jgi:antitoxin component HigA of HigAB toxin-antitoxin module
LASDEADAFDLLADLIERYEDEHYPIEPVSGLDALRHLVEPSGKTRAAVAAEAGLPGSTLSEILLGRRRLNTRQIQIVVRDFHIDPCILLLTHLHDFGRASLLASLWPRLPALSLAQDYNTSFGGPTKSRRRSLLQ